MTDHTDAVKPVQLPCARIATGYHATVLLPFSRLCDWHCEQQPARGGQHRGLEHSSSRLMSVAPTGLLGLCKKVCISLYVSGCVLHLLKMQSAQFSVQRSFSSLLFDFPFASSFPFNSSRWALHHASLPRAHTSTNSLFDFAGEQKKLTAHRSGVLPFSFSIYHFPPTATIRAPKRS